MASTVLTDNCIELLHEACDRNTPLELHYRNPNLTPSSIGPETLYAQTRLIRIENNLIHIDKPQSIGGTTDFKIGRGVCAYFGIHGKTYTFDTKIVHISRLVDLNQKKIIVGMDLVIPPEIVQQQRRGDHRIAVAGSYPMEAVIYAACEEEPGSVALDVTRFNGKILNLSRGGASVRIEEKDRILCYLNKWYYLSFLIPDTKQESLFLAEIRHIEKIPRGGIRIGLQFLRWLNPTQAHENLGNLTKFLVAAERRLLQIRRKN